MLFDAGTGPKDHSCGEHSNAMARDPYGRRASAASPHSCRKFDRCCAISAHGTEAADLMSYAMTTDGLDQLLDEAASNDRHLGAAVFLIRFE